MYPIGTLALPGGGALGLARCPGREGDLDGDVAAIAAWGAAGVLSLVEAEELPRLGAAALGHGLAVRGLAWWRLPIPDMAPPAAAARAGWPALSRALRPVLAGGGRVLVHCAAGLGRSGTVAAWWLCAEGWNADMAIAAVRAARPGAIETPAQLAFLRAGPPGHPAAG